MIDLSLIKRVDEELYESMELELKRQRNNIELIDRKSVV